MKIYTRTGDAGTTSLVGGKRVSKASTRLDAYGTVDELNSVLGQLLATTELDDETRQTLLMVQNKLFNTGAYLATDNTDSFILPGGCSGAAAANVCRAVCRRAERAAVRAAQIYEIDERATIYLNRLSDYFYLLGRTLAESFHAGEILWIP